MTDEKRGIGDILSTLTIAVLFIVILLLVVFSAASYQHATDVQNANNNERALLSYVTSCVEGNGLNEVEKKDFDGMPGVSISTAESDFERRIYMSDGRLLEEYAEKTGDVHPDDALVIGETKVFEVADVGDGLISIKTDAGVSYVRTGR